MDVRLVDVSPRSPSASHRGRGDGADAPLVGVVGHGDGGRPVAPVRKRPCGQRVPVAAAALEPSSNAGRGATTVPAAIGVGRATPRAGARAQERTHAAE